MAASSDENFIRKRMAFKDDSIEHMVQTSIKYLNNLESLDYSQAEDLVVDILDDIEYFEIYIHKMENQINIRASEKK